MLGNKNRKNKTVIGGVGIALLLCILMVGMTMTGYVQNDSPEGATNLVAADNGIEDDMFALPPVYEQDEMEYDPASELEGMRGLREKGYLLEDGKTVKVIGADPIHYMSGEGSWQEIDLNLKGTLNGWEVTENNFMVYFPNEMGDGVALQVQENIDPIITGINPRLTVIYDDVNPMAMPYEGAYDSLETPSVGGNVIRYPVAEGFDLDYTVGKNDLKQNLIIRDRPVLDEGVAWFGFTEEIRIPAGYGLYSGSQLLDEVVHVTQEEMTIRNLQTGELLVTIPAPTVVESGDNPDEYTGTYFVQAFGGVIVLTTAVEGDWIMDEDRQFPLAIDPSMNVLSGTGGTCYYYASCSTSTYRYWYQYSWARMYRFNWQKYSFPTSSALGSSASVDQIKYRYYINYWSGSYSNTPQIAVMENCGYQYHTSYNNVPTRSCSGAFPGSAIGPTSSYSYNGMRMKMSVWNSQTVVNQPTGSGWKTSTFCNSATACAAGGSAHVTSAAKLGGDIGITSRHKASSSSTFYYYFYASGSYNSYLQITFSGVSDTKAPDMENPAYTGITTYKEGSRTIFAHLTDFTGIDTTSAGAPHMYYSVNNGSYTKVKATTIGSCTKDCKFKAETADLSAGDYVNYYWAYRDTDSSGNMGTSPSGGTGTSPSQMTSAPSTTNWFFVDSPDNAAFAENKLTVSTTKVNSYLSSSPQRTFDRQMTYYEDSQEYVFEFDTSRCGTGARSCFYAYSSTSYNVWRMMWTNSPSYTSSGYGGTMKGLDLLSSVDGGFLPMSAADGASMNLAFLYDTTSDSWAMIGIGDEDTGIETLLTSGTAPAYDRSYGFAYSYSALIPGNITGSFGEFDWNGTVYSTSRANWMCIGTNGAIMFFRYSMTANPTCNSGYYYLQYTARYKWNGFALGSGYYGTQASDGQILMKVSNVKPMPDTAAPTIDHNGLSDSHSKDRTITAKIKDGGDPPSGVNTSASAGIGVAPSIYMRITDANGTVGSWTSSLLNPEAGKTRAQCASTECAWTYDLEGLERGSSIEYYLKAQDTSPATTGINVANTSTYSFEVGDPNKMFIIEWHDMSYTSSTRACTFQAVMYDVTNEIEFKYDTDCEVQRDYSVVGYQDKTRTIGDTIDDESGTCNYCNPFDYNYRIGTSSATEHSWETFDLGMTELPTYDTVIRGTSTGSYYAFYCGYSTYFNRAPYTSACAANIPLPNGFSFEYFGTEYNGSASTPDRVNINRAGAFNLIDNGATSAQQLMYYAWYSNSPDLPMNSGSGSSYARPAMIAPWLGYYTSYYCYDNTALDCSVRTRVIPFEGKGTEVSSDITVDTTWSSVDSPIRINPSSASGYLSISADLTIEPGVEIQVAPGKGISFDGSCDQFSAVGNATDHIVFTGQNNATWKGLAFTGACASGTDDRHTMSYVDFSDTADAAIAAGSRHGSAPSSNSNVGNFTMTHVTFSNVETAFEHGSGAGTVVTVSDFSVSDASHSCFNFAEDSVVTITNGTMDDCNSAGNADGAAIQNVAGSTAGSLYLENVTIDDSLVNLINVDLADVWINNVTATAASTQSGLALNATGGAAGSTLYVADFDAPDYSSGNIMTLSSIVFDDADLGDADITIRPGGNVNTAGPSGVYATFDNFTAGNLDMARMSPYMYYLDVDALTFGGNAPGADSILGNNWDTEGIAFNGCGYSAVVDTVATDYLAGSCSASNAPNSIVMSNVDVTYTGWQNAFYARNTGISIGTADVTMPVSYQNMAYAGTNGRIVLVDVDQGSTDCDGSGACSWGSSSSGDIYFGDVATVNVYKDLGNGNRANQSGHTVQAAVVDASSVELFVIGSHTTDSNGNATVWVVTKKDDGTTYDDHNLNAYGPAGQNETLVTDAWYPGSFSTGDHISLKLEPVPISLNGSNMDCNDVASNPDAALGWNSLTRTFTWEGKVTLTGNLNVNDCTIIMKHTFTVISDATNSPKITIMNGGKMTFMNGTTSQGNLRASSSSYPLDLDIDGGILEFIDANARDIAGGLNIDSGSVVVSDGSVIYGSANQLASQATVYVNGGTLDWDDSSIINNQQSGIGLMVESTGASGADIDNIAVKNAEVGIYALKAAPDVDGFTLTDNDVGIDVEGGMSLPTIYRSPSIQQVNRGWTTYALDVSGLINGDYLQVGWNAVYGGGSAHPAYSALYSKYFMIYDNPRLALTDGATEWNISSTSDTGYYSGTGGGLTNFDCGTSGYHANPVGSSAQRNTPAGYDWLANDNSVRNAYPYNYWSFYSPSFYFNGWSAPPSGISGYYNICGHYSYYTRIPTGASNTLAMPIVDVSDYGGAGSAITGATLYVDVLHANANNYQDRIEIVARSGNNAADLGDWVREMGTASFATGTITGGETGIEVGGQFAAGMFDDITVSNPSDAGFSVTGSASATVDQLEVSGGDYGILVGQGASGTVDMTNAEITGTNTAGVYYLKDMKGDLQADIHNNTGSAMKFGSATSSDLTFTNMNLANNGIGIESAGSGELSVKYSDFLNTKDVVISGGATVNFIEGTIDMNSVEVTGVGVVERMREVNITVTADTNAVSGANVMMQAADGTTTGSAVSDSNGNADGITFTTTYVDSAGINTVPLAGYQAVTVAQVGTYSSSFGTHTGDFRYIFDSMSLTDDSGNEHELVLTDSVDSRICYSYSSSSYNYVARCAGSLSTSGSRTLSSGITEYGYYGATPSGNSNTGLNGEVVMVDTGIWYIDGNTKTQTNDSTLLFTATSPSRNGAVVWSTYPYGAELYSNNSTWLGLSYVDGKAQGIQIGYFNWNDVIPMIHNSKLTNILSIVNEPGPYSWVDTPFFDIQNNVITHVNSGHFGTSTRNENMCLITAVGGVSGTYSTIKDNVLNDCLVGTYVKRAGYYYRYTTSQWGADGAVIENNTFNDVGQLGVWFALNSYADDVTVKGNTFAGSTTPEYGVYVQDRRTTGLVVTENTFSSPQQPIYLRGAVDYEVTDNVIYGDGDSAHAGIYTLSGNGLIDGNTLVDADGGILVDGIRFGYTVNVTNNDISQSTGRTAPAAVGIWAEDCGSSIINTGGNTISVMENGIVTEGCDLVDTDSTITAVGGSGGQLWTVGVNAQSFAPQNITISTGDTIRWRANEYWTNATGYGEPHDVVSNDSLFSSGVMNLGSTHTYTFLTAGTYTYHCSLHPALNMWGSVTVTNASAGSFDSIGINIAGTNDDIVLHGTEATGFTTTVEQTGGSLTVEGDALLSGNSYGVYAEDTDVVVDGAHMISGSNGSAMYVTGTSTLDATDMDTSGKFGLNSDGVDFRWNGGESDADTALIIDGGAEGSVENLTWDDVNTQIDARDYSTVTSVGNTVDASKLILASTAVIHEGNLLNLDITHKSNEPSDVGLLIQSTDGEQAAYVSPAYRNSFVTADGDTAEWFNNVKNPSDDAMPGVMSDTVDEDFLATWDANYLHLALTGVDFGAADLQIYIDSTTGGDTTGQSWYVSHSLPFAADYVFWAEDGTDGNSGLKVNGFTGWTDVTSSCNNLDSYIGWSGDTDTEISIPWDCIGEPSDTVRMIVIVQDESTGAIESVHPDQSVATGATGQTFTEEMTLMLGHSDLADGDSLQNHLLIYRSYVGTNTPTDAKEYDISVKVDAICEEDWHTVTDVSMATNVNLPIDIKRACPVITDLIDITVDEDSGLYTLSLLDKADDVQDDEVNLVWTVSDDADPTNSPSMLLSNNLVSQDLLITPDHDQFGAYTFHFEVEDSHGLTDSETIVFTVVNVNDAPIICNTERADCMPVFSDDGAGNLNVLDEGFGSVSKVLGSAANATGSYIIDMASNDMANEQPQVYNWAAKIKSDNVTVEPYWVQKKYATVPAMFAEVGAVMTAAGGWQDIAISGDPTSITPNGTYVLPTLNDVTILTYLLAQNGCGSVWYQEYMDSSGNKVTAVRSDDGCDSTIDATGKVYSGLNYTDFWMEAYGVDTEANWGSWDSVFTDGFSTTSGYNPCPAYTVSVINNELTIKENADWELGGDCTIVLSLNDDGGYCQNTYLGRTSDVRASCVSYSWLIDYPVTHPVYGPITVTGCYNLYLGLASFIPEYMPDGTPTGMTQTICQAYGWVDENTQAEDMEVVFSVTPVNDAPEVVEWNANSASDDYAVIMDGNGDVPNFPWKVTLTEDDESVDNLTYDLAMMKHDNDHNDEDLVWSIVKSETCDYENYFSATINGDDIVFDLIKDATTNAPEWEVDYLNNGGKHQKVPLSGEFCPITLYLHDTATAPSYIPNYGMSTANYQQGEDSVTLYIRVDNVAENVPDYYLDSVSGFDFNGVSNIMPKTFVPTTVSIGHGGDEGPYNYDHMLEVTFHSDGYNNDDPDAEEYVSLGTQYVVPPAYGEEIEVTDQVYITATTSRVWVEVDVLTCVAESCDMTVSPTERFFGYSFPYAHACVDTNGIQQDAWSCPGEIGTSSVDADGNPSAVTLNNKRRPMLEDQDWCNNLMSTDDNGSDCAQPRTFGKTTIATGQDLPTVVRLIGIADVPSFAPSIIAISAAGLFVSALVLQSRRDEEQEELDEMTLEDDEQAVSPVIATILMVAITVVLSGVIYVWASSLADTSAKGVPRISFTIDSSQALGGEDSFHRIAVTTSQVELATQAVQVTVEYTNSVGDSVTETYNLADTTVYGFFPGNSDTMVTFTDAVGSESGVTKSSFDTGDTIYIRTSTADGEPLTNLYVSISYNPANGAPGSVLRTWSGL